MNIFFSMSICKIMVFVIHDVTYSRDRVSRWCVSLDWTTFHNDSKTFLHKTLNPPNILALGNNVLNKNKGITHVCQWERDREGGVNVLKLMAPYWISHLNQFTHPMACSWSSNGQALHVPCTAIPCNTNNVSSLSREEKPLL